MRWSRLLLPQSQWLWSPMPPLGPTGLGSSGLLAWTTVCVHWQMGSSTPTTPSPPGQCSPFLQRVILLSRVKHWKMGLRVAGMIWKGDPENCPKLEVYFKGHKEGLQGKISPCWMRFSRQLLSRLRRMRFPVQVMFVFPQKQAHFFTYSLEAI